MTITSLSTISDATTPLAPLHAEPYPNVYIAQPGQLFYQKWIPTTSGTITELYVWCHSGSGKIWIGIQDPDNTTISYVLVNTVTATSSVGGALNNAFNFTSGATYKIFILADASNASGVYFGFGSSVQSEWVNSAIPAGTVPAAPIDSMGSGISGQSTYSVYGLYVGAVFPPANGIPSLTLEDKNRALMAAGTSVSVTVDTTTGTNVYAKTALTITSANQIPVIDLSSAVTAGTIANGDTVNYRVDYGGETTIVPQTVVASPT